MDHNVSGQNKSLKISSSNFEESKCGQVGSTLASFFEVKQSKFWKEKKSFHRG
jgi:hypothetical protein